jgi:transposase-like protein
VADWNKIKAEYIAGGTSYRKLAEKHGVARQTLEKVAKREGWVALRGQAEDKAEAKIVDTVVRQSTNTGIKINAVADKLLRKLSETIDMMDVIDGQTIKHFTSALKDLRDIKGEKSLLDLREQEARIAKLQKDAQDDSSANNEVSVVLIGDINEYSK